CIAWETLPDHETPGSDAADSPRSCPACPRRHFLKPGIEPGRQRWTVSVVPAQGATTALNPYCRPDDSTHYFAVVGRRTRGRASDRINLLKPLKPVDMGLPQYRWT